jgi:hypothetical protein
LFISKTENYEKKDLCLDFTGVDAVNVFPFSVFASSHREAPLIANDPLAIIRTYMHFVVLTIRRKLPLLLTMFQDNYLRAALIIILLEKISAMKSISTIT